MPGPMRTLTRVHEHRAGTARPVMRAAPRPSAGSAGGQRLQPGHRLGAVAGADGGELGVPGAVVVERVGHIGQRARRRPRPAIHSASAAGHATRSAPAYLPDTTSVVTAGSALADDGYRRQAPARSPHARWCHRTRTTTRRPGAAARSRPLLLLGNHFQPHLVERDVRVRGLEVQVRRDAAPAAPPAPP